MIYIKRQSTSLLLALASLSVVSSSLMSCSENNGLSSVTLSDKKILFTATEVNEWMSNSGSSSNDESSRAVGSYHPLIIKSDLGKPLYLHPVEQVGTYFYNDKDELVTRSGVPLSGISNKNSVSTRGTKVTEVGDEILVSAVSKKDNVEAGYFSFERTKRSGDIWHILNDEYWITNASLSFYAYAPTNASMLSTSDSELSGYRTVHYVAGTGDDIKSHPDFIVAKSEDNEHKATDTPSAVDLHFSHALTAITFAVGSDMLPGTIKSITIKGVKNSGDMDISKIDAADPLSAWTYDDTTDDYAFTLNTKVNSDGETGTALTKDENTLLMLPQSFASDSKAEVEVVFNNGQSKDHVLTASLAGTSWLPGVTIIYKLSASELNTLSMGTVALSETAKTWNTKCSALMTNYDGKSAGLYIVDNANKIRKANVKVSCSGNTWSFSDGSSSATLKSLFSPSYHYFLYYPYQESNNTALANLPTVGTTVDANKIASADAFFESLQSAWTPSSNQGTQANLNANDLQISKGYVSDDASSINFDMDHTMVLADLTLGTTKSVTAYHLSTDKSYTWTGAPIDVTASNIVDGRTMCEVSSTHYAMVVKSNDLTFKGTGNRGWDLSLSLDNTTNIADGTAFPENPYAYELTVGDIYYSDGSLTHQSDELSSGKTPIGVVGYIGNNKWTESGTGTGYGGHALVMGLKTIGSTGTTNNGNTYAWCSDDNRRPNHTKQTAQMIMTSSDKDYGSGYLMTKDLWNNSYFPAFVAVKNYRDGKIANALPFPADKCTGWFMPTIGQCYAVFTQLGEDVTIWSTVSGQSIPASVGNKINTALSKVGPNNYRDYFQAPTANNGDGYAEWTSSEVSSQYNSSVSRLNKQKDGTLGTILVAFCSNQNRHQYPCAVRPFLAF